tara:strand:+ start:19396 stop:19890 length:495 start_codon:yes stop_codon:yes gene_type:complete
MASWCWRVCIEEARPPQKTLIFLPHDATYVAMVDKKNGAVYHTLPSQTHSWHTTFLLPKTSSQILFRVLNSHGAVLTETDLDLLQLYKESQRLVQKGQITCLVHGVLIQIEHVEDVNSIQHSNTLDQMGEKQRQFKTKYRTLATHLHNLLVDDAGDLLRLMRQI